MKTVYHKAGSMLRSVHMLETFLFKTELLIRIHLQQVNFWEGESGVAKMLELLGAGPQQAC